MSDAVRWIKDNEFEPRFEFWTRANVSEVLPEPPTPLGWDLVWEHTCVDGWRDLFVQSFGFDDDELDKGRCEAIGIFGGYAYLGAALFRVWGGRSPGMEPTTIDQAYFGEHPDVPPYVHEPWHDNPRTTEKMGAWMAWATVGLDQSENEADKVESLRVQAERPNYAALSDQALLGYAMSMRPLIRRMFHQHINQSGSASIGPSILAQVCGAIGQPSWAMRLLGGLGGVDSAAPSYAMWEMSRQIRSSPTLTALFDSGAANVVPALTSSTNAGVQSFATSFAAFITEFGSRGPNEWDIASGVWETDPVIAISAIDRMRMADDSVSPLTENASREAERKDLEAKVRAALEDNDEALAGFEMGLNSSKAIVPGRERSKTSIIRVVHEVRMATRELGRRCTERGVLDKPTDIYMLFTDELVELVAGNVQDIGKEIPARLAHRAWLASLEPPFILKGHAKPVADWDVRGARAVEPLNVGDVMTGVQGCPGNAQGRARVILDPTDPLALEPGDILVAPATDPSWTPLFVPAAGVVVDVGAALSHAVIVSRELGIPCVASVVDATRRIPDGAIIALDGDAGTVTVISLP